MLAAIHELMVPSKKSSSSLSNRAAAWGESFPAFPHAGCSCGWALAQALQATLERAGLSLIWKYSILKGKVTSPESDDSQSREP